MEILVLGTWAGIVVLVAALVSGSRARQAPAAAELVVLGLVFAWLYFGSASEAEFFMRWYGGPFRRTPTIPWLTDEGPRLIARHFGGGGLAALRHFAHLQTTVALVAGAAGAAVLIVLGVARGQRATAVPGDGVDAPVLTSNTGRRRPRGVACLAVLNYAGAVLMTGAVAVFLALSRGAPAIEVSALVVGMVGGAIFNTVAGYGLWTLRPWGRGLQIVFNGLGLLWIMVQVARGDVARMDQVGLFVVLPYVGAVANALILWYMWQPHVRAAFSAPRAPADVPVGATEAVPRAPNSALFGTTSAAASERLDRPPRLHPSSPPKIRAEASAIADEDPRVGERHWRRSASTSRFILLLSAVVLSSALLMAIGAMVAYNPSPVGWNLRAGLVMSVAVTSFVVCVAVAARLRADARSRSQHVRTARRAPRESRWLALAAIGSALMALLVFGIHYHVVVTEPTAFATRIPWRIVIAQRTAMSLSDVIVDIRGWSWADVVCHRETTVAIIRAGYEADVPHAVRFRALSQETGPGPPAPCGSPRWP